MFFVAVLVLVVGAWILIAVAVAGRARRVRRFRRGGGFDSGTWSAGGIWFGDSGGSHHGHSGCGGGHGGHSGCGGSSCGGGGGGCGGGSSS